MKIIIIIGVILIVCVVLILFCWEAILLSIGDFLVVQDELQHADVIHVIAGPDYRTDYAIQLFHEGYGKKIFFTGGWCSSHNYYHGQHGREMALGKGIAPEAIAIDETKVTSTYSEAERLKEFIDQHQAPIRSVIVVGDPFHMRRARWTYRRLLGNEIQIQMAPVQSKQSLHQRHWWRDEGSRNYVRNEYLKIPYYYARYYLTKGILREWLASFDTE